MATTAINVERGSDTPVLTFGLVACSNGKLYISTPTTDFNGYIRMLDQAKNELRALLNSGVMHPTTRTNRVHGMD